MIYREAAVYFFRAIPPFPAETEAGSDPAHYNLFNIDRFSIFANFRIRFFRLLPPVASHFPWRFRFRRSGMGRRMERTAGRYLVPVSAGPGKKNRFFCLSGLK